jgi:hypothetical protein
MFQIMIWWGMPYYLYAIHTDDTDNRFYGTFDSYSHAEKTEQEMRRYCFPHDNYRVVGFLAADDFEAEQKADGLRPHPKLP